MAKKKKEFMNDSFPIFTSVNIPYVYFEDNFEENSSILKTIKRRSDDCVNYIISKYVGNKVTNLSLSLEVVIKSDRKLNKQITLDKNDIYSSLAYNLNLDLLVSESKDVWHDKIKEKIDKLRTVKTYRELFKEFPSLYINCYLKHLESIDEDRKMGLDYEVLKNINRDERKRLEKMIAKKSGKKDFELTFRKMKEEYKYMDDFSYFIDTYADVLDKLLLNAQKCEKVLDSTVIDLGKLSEEELLKFELLVATSVLQFYKINNDDKLLLYVRDFLDRNRGKYSADMIVKLYDLYPDTKSIENARISDVDVSDVPVIEFNFDKLSKKYDQIAKDKPYLNEFDLSIDYKNKSKEEILDTITILLESMKDSYTIVSESYVKDKIDKAINNSSYDKSGDTLNKIDSLKRKVDFLFQNKPTMLIEGKNTFTNYFGYVYKNGYVVFDYIIDNAIKSYGHAIYVIKLDDLNKYSTLSLSQLKKEHKNKIITINHKGDWETRLNRIITSFENAEEYLVPEELKQIDMVLTFDQLYELRDNLELVTKEILESLKEKEKELLENISSYAELCQYKINNSKEIDKDLAKKLKKMEKDLINKSLDVDKELKQEEAAAELYPSESDELEEIEIQLLSEAKGKEGLGYLYDLAKNKKKKAKRNPAVSLKTKLRTKDSEGFLHCDLCGNSSSDANIYGSNRSIKMFESHHIIPISEGGIDNVYNTACLCPGCHTRIHNYLKLRNKLDSGKRDDLPEGTIGEYLTMAEYGTLLNNVRNRLIKDTPEYLPNFEKLFDPYYQREEIPEENKTQEDMKFSIDWNTPKRKV